jgi:hypothetical protein
METLGEFVRLRSQVRRHKIANGFYYLAGELTRIVILRPACDNAGLNEKGHSARR